MSDNPDGLKYDFGVDSNSTYARAARLVAAASPVGRILDLGAGVGALGEAAATHGYGYVGCDLNPSSVLEMRRRGFDAHEVDLNAADVVGHAIAAAKPSSLDPVVAVAVLDVVEHLPDPEHTLEVLTEVIDALAERQGGVQPFLVVSVPNVAHYDLGAKLATGLWDITDVGLLDRTHVTLFTERRLREVFAGGFVEVDRDDVVLAHSEQRNNIDHPVFAQAGLGAYLRELRARSDDWGNTYQFVRIYRRAEASAPDEPVVKNLETAGPFCSVVVRTQARRRSLIDALTTLAAQSDRDIEVLLMLHHDDPAVLEAVRLRVAEFDDEFAAAVHVIQVIGGGRSAPLNQALDVATGRYLAFLDDDDIVTSNWIAEFRRLADLHPGALVRCGCVVQDIVRRDTPLLDFESVSGFATPYPVGYDLFDAVRSNRSPPCSFAVPMAAVRALHLRFDESLRVCEDWKFQLDVVRYAGFAASREVTSVYRRWAGAGGSADAEDRQVWITDHERVVDDLSAAPTIMPPGALRRMHDLYTRVEQLERELGRRGTNDPPLRFTD